MVKLLINSFNSFRWLSEKYDGIRAYWTGGKLLTRAGKEIIVPNSIKDQLPPIALDGELWYAATVRLHVTNI